MFEIPTASRPPLTTTSADGTTIAYDVHGDDAADPGPLVVLVGGATMERLMSESLAVALAAEGLTGVTYDRRGRGDSGDTAPYAVQREVDDLAAVVEAVRPGGRACAVGFSSGAALVLQAVAAGAPLSTAVPFEPPYRVEGWPPLPEDYIGTLDRMTAQGRHDDALEYFQVRAVGLPQEMVDGLKGTAFWSHVAATAPTLAYDGRCLGGDDQSFPTALVESLDVPVLALASTGSPSWLTRPAEMVGAAAPHGRYEALEGDFHTAPDDVIAAAVARFVRS